MTPRHARLKRRRGSSHSPTAREWIGASFTAPFFVHDCAEPYRPGFALWLELPDGFIVGRDVFMPEEAEGALARTLRHSLTQPAAGLPRLPDVIRVADAATAAEVRAEIAGEIPVTVAPTPEFDEMIQDLFDALSKEDGELEPSYLEDGRVSAAAVEALFKAGNALFALQPWKLGDEPPVLRMDIPALDVEDACVSIIGQLDEVRGVLIFRSLEDFEEVLVAAEARASVDSAETLGSEVLALTFESATELPRLMRREAMEHGWRVDSADAYPLVQRRDPDGVVRPLAERDVEIATACARSLSVFLGKHAAILSSTTLAPICESYVDDNGREVLLTVPIEALEDYDLTDSEDEERDDYFESVLAVEPFRPRTGRNEPCPCGSGRKYKKCHLPTDEARHADRRRALAMHEMDVRLVARLMQFARRELGRAWQAVQDDFANARESLLLLYPLSVYSLEVDGKTVVDAYLEVHGRRCDGQERRWLDAQRAAWLSVWEVEDLDPGKSLILHDLLSGERRAVLEAQASTVLAPRDGLLARVVDHDGISLLGGAHANMLPPFDTAHVLDRARARLSRKRAAIPVERLRDAALNRDLLRYWEEAVEEARMRAAQGLDLRNRDGDPLAPTVDRFEVASGAMAEINMLFADLEGALKEDADEDSTTYVFLRPGDETQPDGEETVLGWLRLEPTALRIETNSQARADALRERIEAACGARIRHRTRDTNPLPDGASPVGPQPTPAPPSPEEERLTAEHKARHYALWPDLPLPGLNQKTPRECARTAAGRREVDLLLKHMENAEHRAGGRAPYDFSVIRDELGIAPR